MQQGPARAARADRRAGRENQDLNRSIPSAGRLLEHGGSTVYPLAQAALDGDDSGSPEKSGMASISTCSDRRRASALATSLFERAARRLMAEDAGQRG
jgi:hypothetical protein